MKRYKLRIASVQWYMLAECTSQRECAATYRDNDWLDAKTNTMRARITLICLRVHELCHVLFRVPRCILSLSKLHPRSWLFVAICARLILLRIICFNNNIVMSGMVATSPASEGDLIPNRTQLLYTLFMMLVCVRASSKKSCEAVRVHLQAFHTTLCCLLIRFRNGCYQSCEQG